MLNLSPCGLDVTLPGCGHTLVMAEAPSTYKLFVFFLDLLKPQPGCLKANVCYDLRRSQALMCILKIQLNPRQLTDT